MKEKLRWIFVSRPPIVYGEILPQRGKKSQESDEKSFVSLGIASSALRNAGDEVCETLLDSKARGLKARKARKV